MPKVQASIHCENEDAILEGIKYLLGRFYTLGDIDPPPLEKLLKPFDLIVEELPRKNSRQKVKTYNVTLAFKDGNNIKFAFQYKKPRLALLYD